MKSITELRNMLKPLGYSIETRMLSHGTHATYTTADKKHKLTYNVMTPEALAIWKGLFDWKQEHSEELQEVKKATGIYGLV